jgi:hypothetical protein
MGRESNRRLIAASDYTLFRIEIDQDQGPIGERRNARYGGRLRFSTTGRARTLFSIKFSKLIPDLSGNASHRRGYF